MPFINISLWAIVWGVFGSLSAILYRFYTEDRRVKFSDEFRWLIARPIIGVLMSTVAYVSLQTGFIFLGTSEVNTADNLNTLRVSSLICFLAGFSDVVYIGIINLLVERTFGTEKKIDKINKNYPQKR